MYEQSSIVIFWTCYVWIVFTPVLQVETSFIDVLSPIIDEQDVWLQRDTRVAIRTNNDLGCEKPEFYICEEPAQTVPPDTTKTCNYRNLHYHEQVFRWVAGRGCLFYTPDFLYVAGTNTINLSTGCFYGNWFAPCLEIVSCLLLSLVVCQRNA